MLQTSVFLPPELVHHVVDFLADDRQTLYNSALASYSFLHPSRKHIFGHIILRSSSGNTRPARRLLTFLSTAPHLVSYITSLRVMMGQYCTSVLEDGVSGWMHADDALPIVFASLTHLQAISIESTNSPLKWRTIPLDLQQAVIEAIGRSTISRLTLVQVEDFPLHPLRTSNLRNVLLHCVTLTEGGSALCTNAGASPTLEDLQIVEARDSKFLDVDTWLQRSDTDALDLTHLKRLSLTIYGRSLSYSNDMSIVSRLLDLCSPSLEHLTLTPPLMFASPSDLVSHPFHLAPMPNLRRVEFGLEISDFDDMETSIALSWLTELFSHLPTCNVIEEIVLKCEILQANPVGEFDHRIWTKIDKVLTCKELARLRRVTLVLYPIYSQTKKHLSVVTEMLEQEMRILRKRNILQIEKRYDLNRV